ncbi:S-layer homology domain-containing protein [Candidatus Peregrinibacteria bacterium]|nr:S-layer homology domain-containing protein [Candidatus Peregrinibacteria bacterium]MBI4234865.1 S-layer homology domain-containing protein [Candidatus Peregrinibacteria bacterium]
MNPKSLKEALLFGAVLFAAFGVLYYLNGTQNLTNSLMTNVTGSTAENQILSISLDKENVELESGESYTFTAYGEFSTMTIPVKVDWNLSDKAIASLGCEGKTTDTCKATAKKKEGSTTLTIQTSRDGNIFTDSASIKVSAPLKNNFKDNLPSWAQKGILKLNQMGIIQGYSDGNFGSADPLTRAQIVTLLSRLLEKDGLNDATVTEGKNCKIFDDVNEKHFAYKPICYGFYAGWLDVSKGKFKPDEKAPRGLTSDFVNKSIGKKLKSALSKTTSKKAIFEDVPQTHEFYEAVSAMSDLGVMTGYESGTFGPDNALNRAEAAVVLSRVNDLIINAGLVDVSATSTSSSETSNTTTTATTSSTNDLLTTCENETSVRSALAGVLKDNLAKFELRKVNSQVLSDQLSEGTLKMTLADTNGKLIDRDLKVTPNVLRRAGVTTGIIRNSKSGNSYETTPLTPENGYIVDCDENQPTCGAITVLDDEKKQIEASFMDKETGYSFIEPADNLLQVSGGSASQITAAAGCHLLYNAKDHKDILGGLAEETQGSASAETAASTKNATLTENTALTGNSALPENATSIWDVKKLFGKFIEPSYAQTTITPRKISIMLDSDATFYAINRRTVWARQESILRGVNLIYGLVEPLGNGNFIVTFPIEGQETWLPGYGPTTTDTDALTAEINDSDYYMINHPRYQDNEISFFFIGYDIAGGLAGQAGGIGSFCTSSKYDKNHAYGQQVADTSDGYAFSTLYGRTIVMAHEIGHLLNATHGNGIANTCGQGLWTNSCGSTLMKSGAAGGAAPDNRMSFFSPTNSTRVDNCVEAEF